MRFKKNIYLLRLFSNEKKYASEKKFGQLRKRSQQSKKKNLEKLRKDPKIWVPRSSSYSSFLARVHLASISNKITQKPVN